MSELFDKQVNAQKASRIHANSCKLAHEKMCDENEKNNVRVKMLLKEAFYKVHTKNWGKQSQQASSQ